MARFLRVFENEFDVHLSDIALITVKLQVRCLFGDDLAFRVTIVVLNFTDQLTFFKIVSDPVAHIQIIHRGEKKHYFFATIFGLLVFVIDGHKVGKQVTDLLALQVKVPIVILLQNRVDRFKVGEQLLHHQLNALIEFHVTLAPGKSIEIAAKDHDQTRTIKAITSDEILSSISVKPARHELLSHTAKERLFVRKSFSWSEICRGFEIHRIGVRAVGKQPEFFGNTVFEPVKNDGQLQQIGFIGTGAKYCVPGALRR